MSRKPSVPICRVSSCKHFKTENYKYRCILGINNKRANKHYSGNCPLYEPKENAKFLPGWYKKPD